MLYKLIFLFLLTSNVALFIWGYQRPLPQFQPPPVPPSLDEPSFQLVSELTSPNKLLPEKKVIEQPICIRLGPLYGQKDALEVIKMLEDVKHNGTFESETALQNGGFWLVIKAKKSKTEEIMAQLNTAGVMDVWIFDEGPLKGMISLGLYSDQGEAKKRKSSLNELGFNVEIRPRDIEVLVYWIRVEYLESNLVVKAVVEKVYEMYSQLVSPPPRCK